ncbi:HTH-type transcriptional repressor AllR [Polystyrenella longa]|uniref:HTH-type transcriptional repressor AllR n=1 Tax=Polystyrenella longa TaxID=2528007 RepID=A0A518CMB7_9PLAN|nr:IclR family transcriptional regulator [Polystyrenella longa]QDU80343.1 HTH-type transcriptional repressor AllR [Polystyrenella longa]
MAIGDELLTTKSQAPNLQRGLAVLEYLSQQPEGATVTQLSEELQFPTASSFRIANVLVELGYLSKEPRTKKFFLTNRFLLLGQPQSQGRSLHECSIGPMRTIRDATSETTQLCCLIGTEMVMIEQLLSTQPFKYSVDIGARCPCYSNAPGKVIIAFQSETEQVALVDRIKFKKFTKTTISNKTEFHKELKQIRKQGYAVDRAEGLEGIHCIAAPIVDRHGHPVAALTIAGPASRIPEDEWAITAEIVKEGARLASEEFKQQS